ncbi:MAG: 2Fe-2S iron-sulfur cluster-binding protein [Pseudomonadota bacterium]
MTAIGLFSIILIGIILQIGIVALVAFVRHWRAYVELKRRVATGVAEPAPASPSPAPPSAWRDYRPFRVRSKAFEDRARSIYSFVLEPADGGPVPGFLPGQFLTFRLNIASHAPPTVRCYSLSDRPGGDAYRVSIKRVPAPDGAPGIPPGLSSNHFHDHVREGDVLDVKAPSGHFHLDPKGAGPVVLVAGGIGVTPMVSMAAACLNDNPGREVWFFYGVRDGAEEAFAAPLRAWADRHPGFHLHLVHSRPAAGEAEGRDFHHRGHVDIALLRRVLPLKPFDFYICGPRAMMESLVPALLEWGVPAAQIHYEAFGPASLPRLDAPTAEPAAPAQPLSVTFARSGRQVTWTGGSLLDLAEANGIAVDSGCRAGGCGMCQTHIEDGEVDYEHSPDFDPEPGACLLCVGRPRTNLVLRA